jgi:hypothetical protein
MGQFYDDEMKAVMERACAQRDAAVARAEAAEAALAAALAQIAAKLDLVLPPSEQCDHVAAIVLDVGRLLDVQKLWVAACKLVRVHCPVEAGESHIQQGIPRLAKRVGAAEADAKQLRAEAAEANEALKKTWAVADNFKNWYEAEQATSKALRFERDHAVEIGQALTARAEEQRNRARAVVLHIRHLKSAAVSDIFSVEDLDIALADEPPEEEP